MFILPFKKTIPRRVIVNPIAFRLLGLDIRWYGVLIACGMALGILIASYSCKVKDVDYDTFMNTIMISLPIGIIGARLYYVLFEFSSYKDNLWDIFNIREGGLAIHGGIIFVLLSAIIKGIRLCFV
jgi:phosphatidylglycerol:prolipoprotein diacylglycerol transferase